MGPYPLRSSRVRCRTDMEVGLPTSLGEQPLMLLLCSVTECAASGALGLGVQETRHGAAPLTNNGISPSAVPRPARLKCREPHERRR